MQRKIDQRRLNMLVIAGLVVAVGFNACLNVHYRHQAEQQSALDDSGVQRRVEFEQSLRKIMTLYRQNLTKASAEEQLNSKHPFQIKTNGATEEAEIKDDKSGATFILTFREERWTGIEAHSPRPVNARLQTNLGLWRAMEMLRQVEVQGGLLGFFFALAMFCFFPESRGLSSRVALIAAFFSFVAELSNPWRPLPGFLPPSDWVWPLVALVIALFLLGYSTLTIAGKYRRPAICKNCGYDLTGNRSGKCPECGTSVAGRNAFF